MNLQQQNPPAQNHWRTVGVVIAALILSMGILLVLSTLHILDPSWTAPLGAIFTVLGVLLALVSWLWPRTPSAAANQERQGEIEVLVRPNLCGSTVYIDHGLHTIPPQNDQPMTICERRNGNAVEYVAERSLDADNYTISINRDEPIAHVTIVAGQRRRIDWRYIRP